MLVDHFCHYVNGVIYVSVGLSKAGRRQVGVYEQEEWEGSGDRWKWTSRRNGRGRNMYIFRSTLSLSLAFFK